MISEPCPECNGRCCRVQGIGYKIKHMDAECYEHVCDYCEDGTEYVPQRTAADERADVLAYLAHAAAFPQPQLPMNQYMDTLRELIECGAHVGYAQKQGKEPDSSR